jgi:hypothetical protein
MTVLLLIDQRRGSYVIPRYTGARERILTRLRAWKLDRALAGGASPDSSAGLSLRAHSLIGEPARRELWREIHRLLRDAQRPRPRLERSLALPRREIIHTQPVFEEIAERLIGHAPVEAMGVAQIRLLLRDGSSPLYSNSPGRELERAVRRASDALEARP